jgi:hypothetical protein
MSHYLLEKIGVTGSPIEGQAIYFEVTNNLEAIDLVDLKSWASDCLDYYRPAFIRAVYPDPTWDNKALLILHSQGV